VATKYRSYKQIAERLGVTERSIANYVTRGMLCAVRVGGVYRVCEAEEERFLRELPSARPSAQGGDAA
jgi:excisionase family DNA binding protein